jgi:hypothetical protein
VRLALVQPSAAAQLGPTPAPPIEDAPLQTSLLRMRFLGAQPAPVIVGLDALSSTKNYFLGSDPQSWITGVSEFLQVKYDDIYVGIDAIFHGNAQQRLQYDFHVAAGADPGQIRLGLDGATTVSIDDDGNLVVNVDGADVINHAPVVYQDIGGVRYFVQGRYVLDGATTVRFELTPPIRS